MNPAPTAHNNAKLISEAARSGRDVGCCILFMVIADETDDAAMAKWRHYNDGIDQEAVDWMMAQALADKSAPTSASARKKALPERPINLNMGTLVGSYASIARMLDEAAAVPGTKGLMLCFDDFLEGLDQFGERVQPLMRSRSAVPENANQNIPLTR